METKSQKRLIMSAKYVVLSVLLLLFFLPLISMVSVSLKAESEIFMKTGKLFPEKLHFENYFNAATRIDYLRFVYNSLIVAVMYTVTCTLSSAMAGYALARFHIKENNLFFTIVLSSIMIPYVITLIPFYLLVKNMGLTDKHVLWLIYGLGGAPFMIYLYKQFFSTIPQSFEESARIDGARRFQIFFQIMMPLVKSGTIITAIFAFQFTWQNYIMPALFLSSLKTTLAVKINGAYVDIQQNILLGELMAGVIYYIGIPVLLFFVFQKYIMRGMLEGGVKG
ncbi:carbohydrate ABC transporter permease [Oceanispirochaeta crateris]|uniref:sn-glycerol-3-phosphate transport system permease protein UgpE n=1 Tax=Oceanispirochaeta crateris TaxID=2518645 RepID=A0A5C1QPA1_9SPIO|nr:carbohydrate ABC transporter permease [Oceanispirochaeta crateris]QEN09168.1 carbohydrate ABC transporter permease [Oceanispirochaeta crateris]